MTSNAMDGPTTKMLSATAILAAVSLSPSPNFIGLLGLLVTIQLYPKIFSRQLRRLAQPWAASTLGTLITYAAPGSSALHSSVLSIVLLALLSALGPTISISAVWFDAHYIGKNHRFNWFRLVAFPAFWASLWGTLSLVSPFGRLFMWSPVTGIGPYTWVSSYLGTWGIDFIVAGWATVLAEVIAVPLSQHSTSIGGQEGTGNAANSTPFTDDPHQIPPRDRSASHHKSAFTILLLILALPSLLIDPVPNPVYTTATTPFTLGCALPETHLPGMKPHSATLDHYINETRKMTSAKIVLWPEGALRFGTEAERNKTFEEIAKKVLKPHKGLYIGLGFEDYATESHNKRASKRNGFALLVEDKVVLQYYKRYLVPIAETFSMLASNEAPTIYQLPLGPPRGTKKPDWAEAPGYTRPIPISSSICLDFASQSAFLSLDSRPALILAPARTWHPSVGLAMWNQARMRAHETGTTILWCDGGEGGFSGVIGGGFEKPLQFGEGSWTKTIGLTYPFPERKTVFNSAWVGNIGGFILVWILTGSQAATTLLRVRGPLAWGVANQAIHRMKVLYRSRPGDVEHGEGRRLIEEGGQRESPLLDLDDDEQEQRHQQTTAYGATQRA